MPRTIKPLDDGDQGGRRAMRPPQSLEVIRAIEKQPTPPAEASEALERRVVLPENVDGSEYVRVGSILVGKSVFYPGSKWEQAHRYLARDGLQMLRIDEFTTYLIHVLRAAQGSGKLIDGNGDDIHQTEASELADYIVGGPRPDGVITWLNAKFVRRRSLSNLELETTSHIPGQDSPVVNTESLEDYEGTTRRGGIFVDLRFNGQGLPTQRSTQQEYIRGENLLFTPPWRDDVASFNSIYHGAHLDCRTNPGLENDTRLGIGVLPCIRLVQEQTAKRGTGLTPSWFL